MMERGNEGDELLFLSLKSVLSAKCLIQNIDSFQDISAEILVDTVVHILIVLQSSGLVVFSVDIEKDPLIMHIAGGGNLPSNIASRHRICTALAAKVKDCGYLSDCGYNQLLYPVENQTRTLLTWFSEKLSSVKSSEEEETMDSELHANPSLNKRIKFAINKWKSAPHLVPISLTGMPPKNIHSSRPFRTLCSGNSYEDFSSMITILNKCKDQNIPCDSSIFEKHAHDLLYDSQPNINHSSARHFAMVCQAAAGDSGGDGGDNISPLETKPDHAALPMNLTATKKSLQELIKTIIAAAEKESDSTAGAGAYRGRFALTTDFKQEFNTKIVSSHATLRLAQSMPAGDHSSSRTGNGGGGEEGAELLGKGAEEQGKPVMTEAEALLAARKAQQEKEESARQQELEELKAEVDFLISSVEKGQHNLSLTQDRVLQLETEAVAANEVAESLEKEITLKRKTLEMLPAAKTHLAELRDKSASMSAKMERMAQQWEEVRLPLTREVREKTRRRDERRQRSAQLLGESKVLKSEMADMVQDLKEKQGKIQELSEEIAKLPRNLNRLVYTHRILELTASIAKQNEGIHKITTDIMDMKKTIAANMNILQRADTVCEELVYAAASHTSTAGNIASGFFNNLKAAGLLSSSSSASASSSSASAENAAVLDTYRKLTALRASFDELISVVGKIGQQEAAARDLETKIDQETARISVNNFQRIQSDLLSIRQENGQLLEKVRTLGVGGTVAAT